MVAKHHHYRAPSGPTDMYMHHSVPDLPKVTTVLKEHFVVKGNPTPRKAAILTLPKSVVQEEMRVLKSVLGKPDPRPRVRFAKKTFVKYF
jgi:hypothetical protein